MSKCMTFQILVMTKAAGLALQAELRGKGKESHFFHSGLEAADKDRIHGVLGKITVIATTGLVVNVMKVMMWRIDVMHYCRIYYGTELQNVVQGSGVGVRVFFRKFGTVHGPPCTRARSVGCMRLHYVQRCVASVQ